MQVKAVCLRAKACMPESLGYDFSDMQFWDFDFAGDLWSRFVTEFPEDQDLLAQESGKRFNFRPIVTNYSGNTQEVIRHRLGEASTFAQ